ncbi:MAG: type II toxin-antitoxin system VapC family toxin [Candidatus Hydrogenedentes bacterium]|nr:type II toxin-antitoxin system VapC family toxin [Candidatus Hydrogenedentota bacterium]
MVFDTDVLIWVLRGNDKAALVAEQDPQRAVSIITCMELLGHARNQREMAAIRQFLGHFETIPLSEEIGLRGCLYVEQYGLKIDLAPADVLIAATAVDRKQSLCTGNPKHYRPISDLELKPFRP